MWLTNVDEARVQDSLNSKLIYSLKKKDDIEAGLE